MLKQKLINAFGTFGIYLYFFLSVLISILPFVMIDLSFIWTLLLIILQQFIPITTIIFWIWGFVCAIGGPQDIFAIIYYIAFAVLYLPFFLSILSSIVSVFRNK